MNNAHLDAVDGGASSASRGVHHIASGSCDMVDGRASSVGYVVHSIPSHSRSSVVCARHQAEYLFRMSFRAHHKRVSKDTKDNLLIGAPHSQSVLRSGPAL